MATSPSSSTPVTPGRTARPTHARNSTSTSSGSIPPLKPDTPAYTPLRRCPDSPITPFSPAPSSFTPRPHNARRKSTASTISTRRKPVPAASNDPAQVQIRSDRSMDSSDPFVDQFSPTRASATVQTPTSAPPQYVLDVAAPLPDFEAHAYIPHHSHIPTSAVNVLPTPTYIECGLPTPGTGRSLEQLPVYAEDVQTEPDTLARKCWIWGFLFPVLWIIGMSILWIPLRPIEEEQDADKAQKLEEMIVILREVELKYARRCAWSFGVFTIVVCITVVVAVVVSRFA